MAPVYPMTLNLGSTISSQLVDLDIADIGGGFSVSADDASWIACVAMAEVASIPIATILVRAMSLRRVAVYSASLYLVCACLSLLVSGEDGLIVLRAMQSFCSGTLSVLLFVSVMATLPPGFARNIGLALFAFASTAPIALNASAGAFVTERWGWQGLYFFDITWGLTFLVLAWRFLRPATRAMRLSEIDWVRLCLNVALADAKIFKIFKPGAAARSPFENLRKPYIAGAIFRPPDASSRLMPASRTRSTVAAYAASAPGKSAATASACWMAGVGARGHRGRLRADNQHPAYHRASASLRRR